MVVSLLVLAAPARASTAWPSGETLYYVAGPGEANELSANLQGADATLQDAGYPDLGMVAPCRPWDDVMLNGTGALCPAAPVGRLVVDLGDGADSLSAGAMSQQVLPTDALGGPGNDRLWTWTGNDDLTGGPGQDVFTANAGNDLIDARDGVAESVDCGDGDDVAVVDPSDTVTGCETLAAERPADRPAPVIAAVPPPTVTATRTRVPAPTPPGATPATPPADVRLTLIVSTVSLRTARTAGLPVRASCGTGCHVSATVRIRRERARRLGVARTLATATKVETKRGTARLRMRLRGAGLRRAGALHVVIHADAVTAAGQHLYQDVELTLR